MMQIDGWNLKDIGYDTGYNHTYGVGTDADAKSTGAADGSKGECQTCKNRKYQDGSNAVSYTHLTLPTKLEV